MMVWQWHQLDYMQMIFTMFQTDNHDSTSSLDFYMPDTLPDAQTTVKAINHTIPPKHLAGNVHI